MTHEEQKEVAEQTMADITRAYELGHITIDDVQRFKERWDDEHRQVTMRKVVEHPANTGMTAQEAHDNLARARELWFKQPSIETGREDRPRPEPGADLGYASIAQIDALKTQLEETEWLYQCHMEDWVNLYNKYKALETKYEEQSKLNAEMHTRIQELHNGILAAQAEARLTRGAFETKQKELDETRHQCTTLRKVVQEIHSIVEEHI